MSKRTLSLLIGLLVVLVVIRGAIGYHMITRADSWLEVVGILCGFAT